MADNERVTEAIRSEVFETIASLLDENVLDETIVDYITGVADQCQEPADLAEVIIGFFPELSSKKKTIQELSSTLISRIGRLRELEDERQKENARLKENRSLQEEWSRDEVYGRQREDIKFLQEIAPELSLNTIEFALEELCHGNKSAASTKLLEQREEVLAAFHEYETEKKAHRYAREREELERAKALKAYKKHVVDRYADEAVDLFTDTPKIHKPVVKWDSQKQKIRYHDNRVVSTNGQKFIVENVKPEWDGGSRGRVKSKGKRGKGWV